MKRTDLFLITLLISIVLIIFFPLFYTEYAYTDELVGLWNFRKGNIDHTLLPYGRYITQKLAELLFGSISTIKEIFWIRLFSIAGWILSIPAWYYMVKKILIKEGLPEILAFFSVLYLICSPPFSVSVSWAACFELFLANTAGLLSGYLLYAGTRYENNRVRISSEYFVASLVAGIISLFTYQNGFGCFLIPFLLHLIAKPNSTRNIFIAVAAYFLISAVYYLLFKYSLHISHIESSGRTGLHINVGNKLPFFLARPMNSAFHFTWLFNEKNMTAVFIYALLAVTWFIISFLQRQYLTITGKLKYFVTVFCLLGLIYLPSLIVNENYASNSTLFALDLAVFFLVAQTFLKIIQNQKTNYAFVAVLSCLFVMNAWYNFNKQFLQPVVTEYKQVRNFIETNYRPGIDTVYFIRPQEDYFEKKYGITRSWDEFGVPSAFFEWTPEYLVKQIVFEKTRKRETADKLFIKNWLGKDAFLQSGFSISQNTILIDAEKIMNTD